MRTFFQTSVPFDLIEAATILKQFTSKDVILGRMQADQFALCCPKSRWDEKLMSAKMTKISKMLEIADSGRAL